jgi:selenocysteine-specific elongation factor
MSSSPTPCATPRLTRYKAGRVRTVATAGHVDHGKSSLVLALTGTDPDRFPEEKARGLTIDLGFAFTTLPSGTEIGFVDVPGHVRFIKNMLAGVGAVDTALLVVAANEGWMPQSEEHLRILELLGIRHGLTALTKAAVVDDETLEIARLELDDHLAGTVFADAPIVAVDSRSGRGLPELREALDKVLAAAPPASDRGRPRLWVDRAFAARGAGTVVTGTLAGGRLAVDDEVVLEPGSHRARVRGVESRHQKLAVAEPGSRVALNLAGVEHHDVARGHAVVRPGQWHDTATIDVAVSMLPGVQVRRRARLQVYVGSGEHNAVFRALDDDGRFARLRFEARLAVAPGDRVVLRDPGSGRTIGGAEVLDVAVTGRARDAAARLGLPLVPRLLAAQPWLRIDDLHGPLTGLDAAEGDAAIDALVAGGGALRLGPWLVAREHVDDITSNARRIVLAHHADHPLQPGVELPALATTLGLAPERLRLALEGDDALRIERGVVRHIDHRGRASDDPEAQRLLAELEASPFSPPGPADVGVGVGVARALVREGAAVDLDGVVFAATALEQARSLIVAALHDRGTLTVADARDILHSTRKFVLPLLTRLDAEGVTRRRGDERVLGPAAR